MIRNTRGLAALIVVALAGPALADPPKSLLERLTERVGETLDVKKDAALIQEVVDRGLIERGRATLQVDASLLKRVIGNERYRARQAVRYFVGDRILVEQNGEINQRAEIAGVNKDGTYSVKVWDKYSGSYDPAVWDDEQNADARPIIDALTGRLPDPKKAEWATTIDVTAADGTTTQKTMFEPWLERPNERTITLTHDEVERLNGVRNPGSNGESYMVNGFLVDPKVDKVLAERIEGARQKLDDLIKSGKLDLTLPQDAKAANEKLGEISNVLRQYYLDMSEANRMGYPDKPEFQQLASQRDADQTMRVNGQTLVGAMLKWGVGVCFEQTAALGAIGRAVGRVIGVDFLAVSGMISGGGHSYGKLRFPDGKSFLTDPSWLAQDATRGTEWLENIDFATFDARHWSARQIRGVDEDMDHPTAFADPATRAKISSPVATTAFEDVLSAVVAQRMKGDAALTKTAAVRSTVLEFATEVPAGTDRTVLEAKVAADARGARGATVSTGITTLLDDRIHAATDVGKDVRDR
jgi:hypothetical protein